MKNISVDDLKPRMKVAKNIYNSDGNILIAKGTRLKETYIKRLKELKFESIYIFPEGLPEVEAPDIVSEKTRVKSIQVVNETLNDIKVGRDINYSKITETVSSIIKELLADGEAIIHFNDIRNFDSYVFQHSVNVTILSLLIAIEKGFNEMELKKIATGSLLHDVGMLLLDEELVKKKRKLNQAEEEEFKKHPQYGYEILKDNDQLSIKVKHIIYQHHEKLDGSGYPRRLKEEQIIDYAQIVAVANIYDSLTSDGIVSKRLEPHRALKIIDSISGYKLNGEYIKALKKHVAKYPLGTLVILNTGQIAMVTEVNSSDLSSPVVKVIIDKFGDRSRDGKKIDLAKEEFIKIKEVKG